MGPPRKEWNRIYPIKLDTGWYASLPRSICVYLLDSFWGVWKKGGHGGNCFTVVLRDLSYREENDVFDSFEELKRGEIWGFLTEVRFDVADRQSVLIMRCLLLIECQASHGEIRITNMANDLWYNIYVIKGGGNRKNTIWNRHMVATWKLWIPSDLLIWSPCLSPEDMRFHPPNSMIEMAVIFFGGLNNNRSHWAASKLANFPMEIIQKFPRQPPHILHNHIPKNESQPVAKGGFPNYFGMQRFGTGHEPSSVMGRALLQGQVKELAMMALGARARHGKSLEAKWWGPQSEGGKKLGWGLVGWCHFLWGWIYTSE